MELALGGLLHAIVFVYVLVKVMDSGASTAMKVFWIVLVLMLPLIGFIAWLVIGPKSR